jgi:O-antigen/teichoic acid export membrane protein
VPDRPRRHFARDSLQILGGQVAMTALGLVNGIITARWLGPTARGQFQLLTLLPVMLSNFVKLGIPQASVYYMRRRGASASDVASNSIWFALVMGGAAVGVCWIWRDALLAKFLKETPESLLLPSLALIPFVLLQFYLLGVAQAEERFREYNVRQVVPTLLGLVGLTITLVILHMGLVGAVIVQVAIQVFMTLWMTWRVHRESPLRLAWNGGLARGMLSFGSKSYVQTLAQTLHFRVDQFICAYFLTPADVGLYAIAVNFATLLLRIPEASGTVMYPRLAGSADRDAHAATTRICRHTLFVLGIGVAAFAIVGPIAIPLVYGHRYDGAVKPLLILLPGLFVMALYNLLTRNFTSRGRQEVNIIAACVALALNVGLNLVLIPRYGIAGAALANGLSYGTAATMLLVAFVRTSGHSVAETLIIRRDELWEVVRIARRLALRRLGQSPRPGPMGERRAAAGEAD